jgi:hypothetical protein
MKVHHILSGLLMFKLVRVESSGAGIGDRADDRGYGRTGTTSQRSSTAFLVDKNTSSFISGRNIARVKIVP